MQQPSPPPPQAPVFPTYYTPPAPPPSKLPQVGGVLLIVSGILGIAAIAYVILVPPENVPELNESGSAAVAALTICGFVNLFSPPLAVVAGILTYQRQNWRLAVACSFFALFTLGFLFEASILGLAGFVIVSISKKEFKS